MSIIVIEFITLDGIVSAPDGFADTPTDGWAFLRGPGTVAGDEFRLGSTRGTSRVIECDLIDTAKSEQPDVITTDSLSVVRTLIATDIIDEYRVPTILGTGQRLFSPTGPPMYLECLSAEPVRRRGPRATRQAHTMTNQFLAQYETQALPARSRRSTLCGK